MSPQPCSKQWALLCCLVAALFGADTSAAASGYECTASSGITDCLNALDGNITSAWISSAPAPQWLEVTTAGGEFIKVGSYSLTPALGQASSAPRAWRLEGVQGDEKFIMDEVSGQTWQEGQTRIRELTGLSAYRRFRLTLLESGTSAVGFAELQLLRKVTYTFVISAWSDCSVTCGGGSQQREVTCKGDDGLTYHESRCSTGPAPASSRSCGVAACSCRGGLLCTASCTASSSVHPQLGCNAVVDGLYATSWTSAGSTPQWLQFDLGEAERVVEFSLSAGNCVACSSTEAPAVISLQASSSGAGSDGWVDIWPRQSVGSSWNAEETRRWQLSGEGTTFRYWRMNFHQTFGQPSSAVSVAEVGLFAPVGVYRLEVGAWRSCEPLGGNGSCGVGVSTRSVTCFDPNGAPSPVELCAGGADTVTSQSCTVSCPKLSVVAANAHPAFFSILRVSLTSQWLSQVLCAAFQMPLSGGQPSAEALDSAQYSGIGMCGTGSCDVDIPGIDVSAMRGSEFEARCKVVGGSEVVGQGKRAVLRAVPALLGCYGDAPTPARDLPEEKGSQTQVNCADECFGFQYFGLQLRGECFCGNSYGKYGERVADIAQGLTGCDCDGPYFGYWANCIWEQTAGRFGADAMLSLRLDSVTSTSAEMIAQVKPTTRMRCNVTATAPGVAQPGTSASCNEDKGCSLLLNGLRAATTYEVSCEADADAEHPWKRSAILLVRTLDPPVVAPPPPTTHKPLDLWNPGARVAFRTTAAPLVVAGAGDAPWGWMPFASFGLACFSVPVSHQCCASDRTRSTAMEALDFPHTFWLVWEVMLVAEMALGAALLHELLYSRFGGSVPYWDGLSTAVAGSLVGAGAVHFLAFLAYGLLPTAARCLANRVSGRSTVEFGRHRTRYGSYQRRAGGSKKNASNSLASALPPQLDPDLGPSALHFLPLAGILAVCAASGNDIRQVAARKVGLRGIQLLATATQALCSALYMYQPWPIPMHPEISVACLCMLVLMLIMMGLVLLRAYKASGDDLLLLDPEPPSGMISAAEEPYAGPAPDEPPPLLPPQKRGGSRGRRPRPGSNIADAAASDLRALGKPQLRSLPEPPRRVAPRRGEVPKPLPELVGNG